MVLAPLVMQSLSSTAKSWKVSCLQPHHYLLEEYLGSPGPMVGELERRIDEREEEVAIVIKNRIFLRRQIESLELYERWGKSVKEFRKTQHVPTFRDSFDELQKAIWDEVKKDLLI